MISTLDLVGAAALRRKRLAAKLEGPALLPAGRALGRNYPANPFPFRASSHFLYFVGEAIEGAALWLDGERAVLLLDVPDPDATLWHGPVASWAELGGRTELEVAGYDALPALRRGRPVETVPVRGELALEVGRLLERDPSTLGSETDGPLLSAIVSLRIAHDERAIEEMRSAAAVSVRAHEVGMRVTRPGVSELEICAAMEHTIARAGCGLAYGSIVSVHGEVLHNHLHGNVAQAGELLLADVGAESASGWASDITRTWPVSGRFSATQREIYALVLAMQTAALAQVRPGARYLDVHLAAARALIDGLVQLKILRGQVDALLEDGAHALFFPHGVGHLLGLDVHDMEDLGDRAGYAPGRTRSKQFGLSYLRLDRDLIPGMAVTIEPGFYQVPSLLADPPRVGLSDRTLNRAELAKYADVRGIRIEDDVLVTPAGHEVLTQALAKTPDEVEERVNARGTPAA
ncbi:MAG TPA: aminopeptidase P family protein [Polyangiales bacterium]|nr:aminopeptidase P family protein [Polyangiales bacterium]